MGGNPVQYILISNFRAKLLKNINNSTNVFHLERKLKNTLMVVNVIRMIKRRIKNEMYPAAVGFVRRLRSCCHDGPISAADWRRHLLLALQAVPNGTGADKAQALTKDATWKIKKLVKIELG